MWGPEIMKTTPSGLTQKIAVTHTIFNFLIHTPKCTVHFIHFGQNGGWSQEAHREGPNPARPLEAPFGGIVCWKEHLPPEDI